jgi:hypothetical protein
MDRSLDIESNVIVAHSDYRHLIRAVLDGELRGVALVDGNGPRVGKRNDAVGFADVGGPSVIQIDAALVAIASCLD